VAQGAAPRLEKVVAVTAQQHHSEPAWCVRHTGHIRRHISAPVQAGNQYGDGQVTAWLIKADGGPVKVLLNTAHAASVSIELTVDDAALFWRELGEQLRQAGVEL
jgi:hypothetical protein